MDADKNDLVRRYESSVGPQLDLNWCADAVAEIRELRATIAYVRRYERFVGDFIGWCDDGARTPHELDRLQDRARDLVRPL